MASMHPIVWLLFSAAVAQAMSSEASCSVDAADPQCKYEDDDDENSMLQIERLQLVAKSEEEKTTLAKEENAAPAKAAAEKTSADKAAADTAAEEKAVLVKANAEKETDDDADVDEEEDGATQRSLLSAREGRSGKGFKCCKKVGKSISKGTKSAVKATGKVAKDAGKATVDVANDVGNAIVKETKAVTKSVSQAAQATAGAVVSAANSVATWTSHAWDTMKKSVRKLANAAVQFAEDMYNAILDFGKCVNFKKLMMGLLFPPDKPGVDADKSDIDIRLSSNPKISGKIVPTLGNKGVSQTMGQSTFSAKDSELSWSYGPVTKSGLTLTAGASVTFVPALTVSLTPVNGELSLGFEGDITADLNVLLTAEKKASYSKTFVFPESPIQMTGCAPVFCVTLMVQGVATIEATAEFTGMASATITAQYGVSGNINIHIDSGKTDATVSAGKLKHQETIEYASTFKGSITLTAGPVFTLLTTPGVPISLEPFVKAELKAFAQAVTGQTPCGKAGINIYADPGVKALGLPAEITFDTGALEQELINTVLKMPELLLSGVTSMILSCMIPGVSSLKGALDSVLNKAAKAIADEVPDVTINFGTPATLFEKSVCFNVLKLNLPTGTTCTDYNIGCA